MENFQIQTQSKQTIELFKNNYIESEQTRKTSEEMCSKLKEVVFNFFIKKFENNPGKYETANASRYFRKKFEFRERKLRKSHSNDFQSKQGKTKTF